MFNPITKADGATKWTHRNGDIYVATGIGTSGKRFKAIRNHSWPHIAQINLYRGNKWLERDGKRYHIQSVYN